MAGRQVSAVQARRNLVIAAGTAGIAGLLFGYDAGVIAGALLTITTDFDLSTFQAGVAVSAVPIGALFGALVAGHWADELGRRKLLLTAGLVFIIGALVSGIAPGPMVLNLGRLVIGLGIGVGAAVAPVYISEIAPADVRGSLVTFFQLAVTIGILVAYVVSFAFSDTDEGWRYMLSIGAVPGLFLMAGVLRLPPSPRWLMMKGRHDEAADALRRCRSGDETEIEAELTEIRTSMARGAETGGWKDLLRPAVKAALFVGVGLAMLQQITGINTVIYYAPTIIQGAGIGSDSSAILASLGVGLINVLMTVVALKLLDQQGRRTLLIIGVTGMAVSLFFLGISFVGDSTLGTVIAILSLMTFVSSFAISLGPIFWLINAEIYPLSVRGKAAAAGTMTTWLFNFIITLTFLPLIDLAGQTGTFWIYGGLSLITLWFCWKFVPETRGRSLEEIEAVFQSRADKA